MEANDFLVKIKANANNKACCDLARVYNEYKKVSSKLTIKERGTFSLNVLCLLCRNLEKIPSWREAVDSKELLTLSIDCIRETRGLNSADQIKTLACLYHIHKHVIKKNTSVPPELILKISFMAFEPDSKNFLKEYYKTYWGILADRLVYLEKLKGKSLQKLIPKITEDILKILDIYDSIQFCMNILVFLVKKLHTIFSDNNSKLLNILYGEVLKKLSSKNDLAKFKKLNEQEILDLYVKISDCLYVIAENASKNHFEESKLNLGVRTAITLFGHRTDMFHCLQTFYLNCYCDLFENKTSYADAIFKNLTTSCDLTEKLGYKNVMLATYAFLNQFFRLYVEYSVANNIKTNFTIEIQETSLKLMLKLLSMLKYSQQQLKCENCYVKTGLHDSLRLSFLIKHYITQSLENNTNVTMLIDLYRKVILAQYNILAELKISKCVNYEKFHQKLQTDTHNTAILLNRHKSYEFSIDLFEIYIKNEMNIDRNEIEKKNISRAFYNKSICELDFKQYEVALVDAYLGLVFSTDLSSDKYMSLVIDIKAKSLKDDDLDDEKDQNDQLQLMTVNEACKIMVNKKLYKNLENYIRDIKFGSLLKHEFAMYIKLWPSVMPISGVWRSLYQLLEGNREEWMAVEDEDLVLWMLLEVISATPSGVRTINNEHFKDIVTKMLHKIDEILDPVPVDIRVVQSTLLFLKVEFDIAEASTKYEWKTTNHNSTDPDLIQLRRTIEQEHEALKCAAQAVQVWSELAIEINTVCRRQCLLWSLQLAELFVRRLLYLSQRALALHVADVCCRVAHTVQQKEIFVRNVGVLAYHIEEPHVLRDRLHAAAEWCGGEGASGGQGGAALQLDLMCDVAIHYSKCGFDGAAENLMELVQAKVLETYEQFPDIDLDLTVGRLMEAQLVLGKKLGTISLTDVITLQRHYLSINNREVSWVRRQARSLTIRYRCAVASEQCARRARSLALVRRARSAFACSASMLAATSLALVARHTLDAHNLQHAQVTIDNRLKYITGLSSERQLSKGSPHVQVFGPKQELEVMLEAPPSRHMSSPTRGYAPVPGYRPPEFLKHEDCECYACDNLYCTIISYIIGGLEASMYFRADETDIARNYFQGVINSFHYFDAKLKFILNKYTEIDLEKYIIDHVKNVFEEEFRDVKLEILIEATYFELKNGNFDIADDNVVGIYEILKEMKCSDVYLNNEVMNLMIASARMRNAVKKQEYNIENEFENLKLSSPNEVPKTPDSKCVVPDVTKNIVIKDEEIPKKLKVIKLNLDEDSSDEKEVQNPKSRRKREFKIPVPVTSKPVLQNITPRLKRKPAILVTDADVTPKVDNKEKFSEFFTPLSTPEQFFTPMSTIKTYSKSNMKKSIVKNLEFSTPVNKVKDEKSQEIPARSGKKLERSKAVERARSPEKLTKPRTRLRLQRQPKFNDD